MDRIPTKMGNTYPFTPTCKSTEFNVPPHKLDLWYSTVDTLTERSKLNEGAILKVELRVKL